MEEKILELYEKIKNQVSEEEFMEEIEKVKNDNVDTGFIDDFGAAQMVVQNYTGVDTSILSSPSNDDSEEMPFEVSASDDNSDESEETEFTMTEELQEYYDKVKDEITEEEFLAKMKEQKIENSHNPYMDDVSLANLVVGQYVTEEVETVSERPEFAVKSIKDLEEGSKDATVSGRVISISNKRSFKTRKGNEGEVCNVELQDNTGTMRCVFWTQNMTLLKKFKEGDIIQIKNVDIKEGYSGLEANLRPRSSIVHLEEDSSKFPVYEETITDIADIEY